MDATTDTPTHSAQPCKDGDIDSGVWRLRRDRDGWLLTIEPATFLHRVVLPVLPLLGIGASCAVLLAQSEGRLAWGLEARTWVSWAIIAMASGIAPQIREETFWRTRRAECLRIGDDGRFGFDDRPDGPCVTLDRDATLRRNDREPVWAVHAWLGVCTGPRLVVTRQGVDIPFGSGLSDADAEELHAALSALPPFAADVRAPVESAAQVTLSKDFPKGRVQPGVPRDPGVLVRAALDVPVALIVVLCASWVVAPGFRDIGISTVLAAAAAATFGLAPALTRMLRGSGRSALSARVIDGGARPGSTVTVRLELGDTAPRFTWLDLRLVGSYAPASDRNTGEFDWKRSRWWTGLWRLPENRFPPGPGEHVDARFVLPDDARPSGRDGKMRMLWALRLDGGTRHGVLRHQIELKLSCDGADERRDGTGPV